VKLGIQIDKKFQGLVKKRWLRRVVAGCFHTQSSGAEVELGLLITDDETVRELNRKYRGIDKPTDVISFALTEEKTQGDSFSFVTPPDGLRHLGEVIVSYPQAVRQAEEQHHGIEEEIALLVVHGTLHLLGYEHDDPANEQEMKALEEKVLFEVKKR